MVSVRFIYLDEAGTSENEPVAVVAGVFVDADRRYKIVEKYIASLIEKHVPPEKRRGFSFHAKELVGGGGKVFPRSNPPDPVQDQRRLDALWDVARITRQFSLPIVIGWCRKDAPVVEQVMANFRRTHGNNERKARIKKAVFTHQMAYTQCLIAAELYMRDIAKPGEVAVCVAEDGSAANNAIKASHYIAQDPELVPFLPRGAEKIYPISFVVDTVHFAKKHEAKMLQIADVCAYAVRRYLNGQKLGAELMEALSGNPEGLAEDYAAYPVGYMGQHPRFASKVSSGDAWFVSNVH